MKNFLIVVGIIGVFAVVSVLGVMCHVANTAVDSATGVVDKTLDPNNVIYNYEFFKSAKQDIDATSNQIADAQRAVNSFDSQFKNRHDMERDDKQESDRLHSVLQGLQQERQNQVATYNARAQMANRNIFRTNDLPNHIE
jgi:hypothetical protein